MEESVQGRGSEEGSKRSTIRGQADSELSSFVKILAQVHAGMSDIEVDRYQKKWNQDFTNAIQQLSQGLTSLQRYIKERKKDEKYGTEEA